jgi:hypothetical protein
MDSATREWLDEVFRYHAPREGQPERYEAIRAAGKVMAAAVLQNCPQCADRTAALQKIREAVFMANASVALSGMV